MSRNWYNKVHKVSDCLSHIKAMITDQRTLGAKWSLHLPSFLPGFSPGTLLIQYKVPGGAGHYARYHWASQDSEFKISF